VRSENEEEARMIHKKSDAIPMSWRKNGVILVVIFFLDIQQANN
jgi:hypothetical protein